MGFALPTYDSADYVRSFASHIRDNEKEIYDQALGLLRETTTPTIMSILADDSRWEQRDLFVAVMACPAIVRKCAGLGSPLMITVTNPHAEQMDEPQSSWTGEVKLDFFSFFFWRGNQ